MGIVLKNTVSRKTRIKFQLPPNQFVFFYIFFFIGISRLQDFKVLEAVWTKLKSLTNTLISSKLLAGPTSNFRRILSDITTFDICILKASSRYNP